MSEGKVVAIGLVMGFLFLMVLAVAISWRDRSQLPTGACARACKGTGVAVVTMNECRCRGAR